MAHIHWKSADVSTMLYARSDLATIKDQAELTKALIDAQGVLPQERQRDLKSLRNSVQMNPKYYFNLVRSVARETKKANPSPRAPGQTVRKLIVTPREWRALAHDHEVTPLLDKTASFKSATLYDILMRAQVRQLLPERQHTRRSWVDLHNKKKLMPALREAMRFPPPEVTLTMPPIEPEPIASVPETTVPLPETTAPILETPALVPETARAQLHGLLDQFIGMLSTSLAGGLAKAVHDSFNKTMQEAMPALLLRHNERVQEQMRATIVDLLGGPIAAPNPTDTAPVVPLDAKESQETETRRPQPLSIDVLGLEGTNANIVAEAFRDEPGVDLRFYDPDRAKRASLRENVIFCRKFMPHMVKDQARANGINLIHVTGASQSVITMVQRLLANGHALQ